MRTTPKPAIRCHQRRHLNCTTTGAVPILAIAFATTTGLAGHGSLTNYSSIGDHFCIYCDEVNGYYLYSESSGTWQRVTNGAPSISVFTPPTTGSATCVINGVTFNATFTNNPSDTIAALMVAMRADATTSAIVSVDSNGTTMTVQAVDPDSRQRNYHRHRRSQRGQLLRGSDDRRSGRRLRRRPK